MATRKIRGKKYKFMELYFEYCFGGEGVSTNNFLPFATFPNPLLPKPSNPKMDTPPVCFPHKFIQKKKLSEKRKAKNI
jgi:hypothetical protein